ncbi:MAG: DUF2267 domain-containing protein [Acidobacteria bacterium]|nr:DUF2267 domain-containing protein [Acidobacteriota bacterium]
MDELIKQVTERSGISESQARTAVETVVGFLKERLPSPIAGHVDSVINSQAGNVGSGIDAVKDQAGDMLGGIGGMFGNKN